MGLEPRVTDAGVQVVREDDDPAALAPDFVHAALMRAAHLVA